MVTYFRTRLGAKLFLSYLVIILIGVVVLAAATDLLIPRAFDRHLAAMGNMMGANRMQGMMGGPGNMVESLYTNFRAGVFEALTLATLVSVLAAVIASLLVSRQVVAPVQALMTASRRIAAGHYDERVGANPDTNQPADELGQLALSFDQMAARLQETETQRSRLIGDVAHELRTPLTTIKGSMEGLMDGVLPATHETYLAIHREADRLQHLVDDLQALSRVEAGAYALQKRPVAVEDLITATRSRLQRQFDEKVVRLEVKIPPDLPPVLVDEDRIGQVLLNLTGNALQYTPAGGQVTLQATPEDEAVAISVSDNGVGIDAEHLPHVFERFYRVDKSRSRAGGGSGIGLTIAKHLVEAHGGRIRATSDGTGQGSTFTVVLPAA